MPQHKSLYLLYFLLSVAHNTHLIHSGINDKFLY